jgi:hypothetical protein
MSQISKQGAALVRQNVERPLRVMWEIIESKGLSEKCKDAYSHVFKFLDEVDGWDNNVSGAAEPNIMVNGKKYTKAGK